MHTRTIPTIFATTVLLAAALPASAADGPANEDQTVTRCWVMPSPGTAPFPDRFPQRLVPCDSLPRLCEVQDVQVDVYDVSTPQRRAILDQLDRTKRLGLVDGRPDDADIYRSHRFVTIPKRSCNPTPTPSPTPTPVATPTPAPKPPPAPVPPTPRVYTALVQVDRYTPKTTRQAQTLTALLKAGRLPYRGDRALWGAATWRLAKITGTDLLVEASRLGLGKISVPRALVVKPGQTVTVAWRLGAGATLRHPWGPGGRVPQQLLGVGR